MQTELYTVIAQEENILKKQVKATVKLLDQGNTVPFIARYRKEVTGELNEEQIRNIEEKINYLRNLQDRKEEVIRLIDEQDKLTSELEEKILGADILQEVEDLYRPYKQKRRTRATKAIEKGLEPLAEMMWAQKIKKASLEEIGKEYIDTEVELDTIDDVFQGARDIIAEWVSDDAEIRKKLRALTFTEGTINSVVSDDELDDKGKYEQYYDYNESLEEIPPHRILAMNRGEEEEILKIKVIAPETKILSHILDKIIIDHSIFKEQLEDAAADSYQRLIAPSIEREVRNVLTDKAEEHAISVFGKNLRSLLLQPPLTGHVVMGIDPGFRTGAKICVVDERGTLLATATIYPHPPQNKKEKAREKVKHLINTHSVDSIAIGNGTAARETEFFISDLIGEGIDIKYTIVNEAGASVYSASKIAREEFPDLDVAMRGAISIARRLQDPLAELVKIEPGHIGVGLYQHDINSNRLEESLTEVVESVVNYVGVNINTASSSLLKYVAGVNSSVAENIIDYREENGGFTSRSQLQEVYRLGPKTFKQAAGFIRIKNENDPLAMTPIHPESYRETEKLIIELGFRPIDILNSEQLQEIRNKLDNINIQEKAEELKLGVPTLKDIVKALKQPGRDPREELPKPVFRTDVLKLEDLKPDMILQGTVRNVVDFGVFVDIGLKQDGLVHISELSYNYVEDPLEVVQVGDVIRVKILDIDLRRKRVSLSRKLS